MNITQFTFLFTLVVILQWSECFLLPSLHVAHIGVAVLTRGNYYHRFTLPVPVPSLQGKSYARDERNDMHDHGAISDGRERKARPRERFTRSSSIAAGKVGRIIRDEMADIINSGDIRAANYPKEALLRAVSIAKVDFTSDLSLATIHISVMGNSVEKRQVYIWLCANVGQVRHSLAQRLRDLRRLPHIRFCLVDTQTQNYLSEMLDQISSQNSEVRDDLDVEFEDD